MRSPSRSSPLIKLSTTGKHQPRRGNRDSTIHARTSARLNLRRVTLRNGKTLIYADSLATPDYLLINNKNYPDTVTDIQSSFKTLAAQHVDIFIANKGDRFGLLEKRQQLRNGDTQAFFDSNGLQQYVERSRQRFITQLTAQQPQ